MEPVVEVAENGTNHDESISSVTDDSSNPKEQSKDHEDGDVFEEAKEPPVQAKNGEVLDPSTDSQNRVDSAEFSSFHSADNGRKAIEGDIDKSSSDPIEKLDNSVLMNPDSVSHVDNGEKEMEKVSDDPEPSIEVKGEYEGDDGFNGEMDGSGRNGEDLVGIESTVQAVALHEESEMKEESKGQEISLEVVTPDNSDILASPVVSAATEPPVQAVNRGDEIGVELVDQGAILHGESSESKEEEAVKEDVETKTSDTLVNPVVIACTEPPVQAINGGDQIGVESVDQDAILHEEAESKEEEAKTQTSEAPADPVIEPDTEPPVHAVNGGDQIGVESVDQDAILHEEGVDKEEVETESRDTLACPVIEPETEPPVHVVGEDGITETDDNIPSGNGGNLEDEIEEILRFDSITYVNGGSKGNTVYEGTVASAVIASTGEEEEPRDNEPALTHINGRGKGHSQEENTTPQLTARTGEVPHNRTVPAYHNDDDDDGDDGSSEPVPAATPARPAGLGQSAPLIKQRPNGPATTSATGSGSISGSSSGSAVQRQSQLSDENTGEEADEQDEIRQKLQMIRVKFLRLVLRLGQTPHNNVVAQVLYRLGLAEQLRRNTNRLGAFTFERASVLAEQLELTNQEPLDFSCTILVLGKSGVGKSSTINSLFNDPNKLPVHTFSPGTQKLQETTGFIQGIKVKVIDTPGLSPSSMDHHKNEKILRSVKQYIKRAPPDIVLYFDRLDVQTRDFGDVALLRTISAEFGPSVWFNAIIVLTHAASAPPDGPGGAPLSYDMFVTQRTHIVQQNIRQAAGDVRLMNPVSLVENHSACRMNRAGKRVLPNGMVWEPQLLLLSFSSKILAEANLLLKLDESNSSGTRVFGRRAPPLPYLLSTLLQSRPPVRLPEEEADDDDETLAGLDSDNGSDSDAGSDYDDLPPFKRLNKTQLATLTKAQRKAYMEELDYREKLFYKKQLKEERKRRKLMKEMAMNSTGEEQGTDTTGEDESGGGPTSVPVLMPDLVLPVSFDSDYPAHRYRYLDSSNQWLIRPVLETQGWDHDVGYEGLNLERLFVVREKVPVSVSGQLTKDKKECTLQLDISSTVKHSEGKSSSFGLDLQSVGKDLAYTLRGEGRFRNFRRNDTATGFSITCLGDTVSGGVKIEDKLVINKQARVLVSGGFMTNRADVAYGGRVEATMRDKDYPIGRMLSSVSVSAVDWHNDLALGLNVQTQVPVGRGSNVIGHANVSNKGSGTVGLRLSSSENIQIALIALVPILRSIKRMVVGSSSQ